MKAKYSLFFAAFIIISNNLYSQSYIIQSPDQISEYKVTVGEKIEYEVWYKGTCVLESSTVGLQFSQAPFFGHNVKIVDKEENTYNETWETVVGSFSHVLNHYNELIISVQENRFPERVIKIAIRAYNDGVAFRYQIPESWSRFLPNYQDVEKLTLMDELISFKFTANHKIWAADYKTYATHQEEEFNPMFLEEITKEQVIGLPFLVKINSSCYAALTEADLTDWAGMYLKKKRESESTKLETDLSPLPGNPNEKVKVIPGSWSPWRVIMLADSPGALIESEIVNNLNDPCEIEDPSWITPGISAWDHWWSGEVSMNTGTIKEFIQLAGDMGWEYMLIDWHWYGAPFITDGEFRADPEADITTVNPAVNMPEIIDFAKKIM